MRRYPHLCPVTVDTGHIWTLPPRCANAKLQRMLLALAQSITAVIAPPVCALCGGDGQRLDEPWGLDLCSWCEAACMPVPNPCARCGEAAAAANLCAHCRRAPPPYDATFSLFSYAEPVDLLITNLKFRHELAPARVLGILFARAWLRAARPLPQCLVPMPLHASRHRERGSNQTAEIARHIAPRLRDCAGKPLAVRRELLQRIRATAAQSELAAEERAANLLGAFRAGKSGPLPGHVAVLDDVMTTGHTAAAAALALKGAGCRRVEIWTCARALAKAPDPIW
jgi:ComF family protein